MAIKYYTIAEIREMSDEDLIKLSAERNSRNKLSANAEKAMKAAEAAYQKELGIYKPTLLERFKALFRSA